MTWHCLLKTECVEACAANGASRFGVRQLLAAFRSLEPERPVERASADALSAKNSAKTFSGIVDLPKAAGQEFWILVYLTV